MYTIYALYFESGCIYVGMTSNLTQRIKDHKSGKTRSTKNRGPFSVKEIEVCNTRVMARKREKYWKSGCGKEALKYSGIEQGAKRRENPTPATNCTSDNLKIL